MSASANFILQPQETTKQRLNNAKSMKVLQVLHLPRKNDREVLQVLRAKRGGPPFASLVAGLPADLCGGAPSAALATQKKDLRCSECCACHAKTSLKRPKCWAMLGLPRKTKRRPFASLVARLPPTCMKVLQVLGLPRKTSLRGGAHSHHSSPA